MAEKKLNGTVIVTYRCNARCTMCNRYKAPSRPEEELSIETIKKLPRMYFTNITGGEPFIRQDLKEIVRELYKKSDRIVISTNGFFTDRIIDLWQVITAKLDIQNRTDDLCDLSCTIICHVISSCFLYRVHHFRASAPEMISVNSCVIAPCLARLYASSKFEIISSALLVAESIACILAPFSLATDVTKAP